MVEREGYTVSLGDEISVQERESLFECILPAEVAKHIKVNDLHYYRMDSGKHIWFGRLDEMSEKLITYMSARRFIEESLKIF